MKKLITILIILTGLTFPQSSPLKIKGTVKDVNRNPLAFVNVYILNSFDGAMTDEDGSFEFHTTQTGSIEIIASLVGYKKQTINLETEVKELPVLEIILKTEAVTTREVVVTASSFSSDEEKGVALTSIDIYTTPGGAADIFQTLKSMPGITLVSESAELYVRGGDPKETLTLIDQATLYHPYTFESAYGGLFSNISTSGIKNMYFSSGGFSAKYGNALSGILELETKDDPGRKLITLGISMANAEVNASIPLKDETLGLRIGGRRSFTEPIFWMNGGIDDFTVTPVSEDLNLHLNYSYSTTGKIKLFSYIAGDKQGVVVNRPGYTDEFKGTSQSSLYNLQWTDLLFSDLIIKSGLSFQDFESRWKMGILDLKRKDKAVKSRTDIDYLPGDNLKLLAGVEFESRTTNYKGSIPEDDFDMRKDAGFNQINSELSLARFGAYAEIQYSGLPGVKDLFISTGLRTDYISKINLNWIDIRSSAGYRINEASTISFGWGTFHQHPDPRLFSESDGNPRLKSMKAIHYILSYNLKVNDNDDFRIEFYHKKYTDLPLEDDVLNYNSNGAGFANGIDLLYKGSLFGIDGWISYGFINTKRKWMDIEYTAPGSFDITHNFTIVAKYNIMPELQAGINYKYATGRPFTPVTGAEYLIEKGVYKPVYGSHNSDRFKDYHRLDFRLTYLTHLFNSFFTVLYAECLNILDIKNIFGYSYNSDYTNRYEIESYFGRRTVVLGMQINI